jgi:hypothetical protein
MENYQKLEKVGEGEHKAVQALVTRLLTISRNVWRRVQSS